MQHGQAEQTCESGIQACKADLVQRSTWKCPVKLENLYKVMEMVYYEQENSFELQLSYQVYLLLEIR